jgi:hypothetical protein
MDSEHRDNFALILERFPGSNFNNNNNDKDDDKNY